MNEGRGLSTLGGRVCMEKSVTDRPALIGSLVFCWTEAPR